jgi:hypothetical protein
MRLACLWLPAVMIIIALGAGCAPASSGTESEAMLTQTSQLVGIWEKFTSSTCSQVYPDTLQFQENGLYFGQKDPPGTFSYWDVGTFEVLSPKQVKISTANDAIVAYDFSISQDVLTFKDADGCEFKYRRVQ